MTQQDSELAEFFAEAIELLDVAEKSLLVLEQGGDFKSNFDTLFRVFHNLKGTSGMLGLTELGHHMHEIENLLNGSQAAGALNKAQIDTFLSGLDKARGLLGRSAEATPETTPTEVPKPPVQLTEAVREFLVEAQEIAQRASQVLQTMEKKSEYDSLIDSLYRDIHTLKGGAYLFHFTELGDLNHAMESVLDRLRRHEVQLSRTLIDALFGAIDLIDLLVLKILNGSQEATSEKVGRSISFLNLYVSTQEMAADPTQPQRDTIMDETPISAPPITQTPAVAPTPPPTATATVIPDPDKDSGSSIRVPVNLLDKLMTLVGEMVLVRNQVIQYSNRTDDLEFLNLSQRLNVVTGEIQGEMMKTRMQPIGNVLTKFTRLVRELSKDLGKKIELHLSGVETELDKTLLEAVKDPLTHIVRNSCDHGIETIEERKLAGKPEQGNIYVNSFHEGGQVIIEIRDDGKGLHRDKLRQKAIDKGILSAEKAATLSDREVINLIFAPGFSTAAKVTNISGRGVGMDVVRTNIERISGSVELQSEAGKGTVIRLKIPLTLAIVPAMIVRGNNDFFAIPQLNLVELVRVEQSMSENKIEYIQGNPVYRLRGNILPLLHLREVLGLPSQSHVEPDVTNIIVLKSDQWTFGLIVDEIQDTADIVVKPLARFLKSISVFSGATVLGDGSIALILDVAGIIKEHIASGGEKASHSGPENASDRLGIEDSQDFLLLRVGTTAKHAILLAYVHRLEEFKKTAIELSGHRRLVRYRNSTLPLISLDESLGLPVSNDETSDVIKVVVIEKGGALFGIEVAEILDVLTTAAQLDTTLTSASGVVGNLVTDQEIVVVIDPYKIIQSSLKLDTKAVRRSPTPLSPLQATSKEHRRVIRKILYAEDAAFFRRYVANVLREAGYEVTLASNGKEAFELLESSPPDTFDLILSDIEMPMMNGFELAVAIRNHNNWKQHPLLALSTRSDKRNIERGLQSGFNAYLEKMNEQELLETIADYGKGEAA